MTLCEGALRCPFAFFVFRGRWFWAGVRGGWFWCAVARWLVHGASCRVRWRGGRCVARRAGGALLPRRSRCSRSPGARGCAPLSPDPYPRQAELAGFCALRARAGCAGARGDPPVCAGAWGDVLHGALVARSCRAARFDRGPRGQGLRAPIPGPLPAAS